MGQKEIGERGIVRNEKAEPPFIARDRAADRAELCGGTVTVTGIAQQLAFAAKGIQNIAQTERFFFAEP